MTKYPQDAQEREKLDISYTNNIYSEYIGCHIFQMQLVLNKIAKN